MDDTANAVARYRKDSIVMGNKKFIPRSFTIPDTIEGVAGLLTARKWEKAAIVYAWTLPEESGGRPKKSGVFPPLYNVRQFAALGIAGLTNHETVSGYRSAWVWAIENDLAPVVEPGDEVDFGDLASVDFPPLGNHAEGTPSEYDAAYESEAAKRGVATGSAKRAGANKAAAQAAYRADPQFRKAIREVEAEQVHELAEKTQERRRSVVDPKPQPSTPIDDAVSAMDGVIEEATRREYLETGLQMAVAMHEWALEFAESYGHTGVADEVEKVHQISHHLTEAQWKIATFAVEQEEGAR
jgi:hypothetical protein